MEAGLRDELLAMAEADQAAARICYEISEADPRFTGKFLFQIPRDEWVQPFYDTEAGTQRHAARMHEVLDQFGWPGANQVGVDGAAAAWLLVQHADPTLQRRCLPLLAAAVKAGHAEPAHLAMVVDRIELQEGRPQVYGTHLCVPPGGGRAPVHGVVEPASLDERRAALGLSSWDEYVAEVS